MTLKVTRAIADVEAQLRRKMEEGKLDRQPGKPGAREWLKRMCLRADQEPGTYLVYGRPADPKWAAGHERRAAFRVPFPSKVEYDDELARPVIDLARAGNACAIDVLREIVRQFVANGHPLPPNLGAHVAEVYGGQSPPRQRKRSTMVEQRDFEIARAVANLARAGFKPTAKDAPNRSRVTASGCWIVAQALIRIGLHLSVSAIEKAWSIHQSDVRLLAKIESRLTVLKK